MIGSAVGPAPYPALVRDLQRVIGDEARAQALEAEGALPARVIACVGGGSNAIGIFHPFLDDAEVALIGVEAAGEGLESGATAPRCSGGAPASCTARSRRCSPTRRARSWRRTRSPPASTTRASAPSTPSCATPAAPATSPSPTRRRCAAFRELARLEGIIPALESSHAIAWLLANGGAGEGFDLVCLSGRGDKDLAEVEGRSMATSRRVDRASSAIAAAFDACAADEGRAALMPYLMAGFPDRETSLAVAAAYADSGADLIELGVPFSDPLADGPTIHAAATAALEAGATLATALETCRSIAERVPVVLMIYANMVLAHGGPEQFAAILAASGAAGAIVPDLPLGEDDEVARRARRRGPGAGPAGRADHRRRSAAGQICERAEGFVYLVSTTGTTGERAAVPRRPGRAGGGDQGDAGEHPGRGRLRDLDRGAGRRGGRDRRRGDHRQPPGPRRRRGRLAAGRRRRGRRVPQRDARQPRQITFTASWEWSSASSLPSPRWSSSTPGSARAARSRA